MTRCRLTGLLSKKALEEALDGPPRLGVFVDIAGLTWVNADLGFSDGDGVLSAVGRLMDRVADEVGGAAYRLGGDEFIVLLPAEASAEAALQAARRCVQIVEEQRIPGNPKRPSGVAHVTVNAVAGPVWVPLRALHAEREADVREARQGQEDVSGLVVLHARYSATE